MESGSESLTEAEWAFLEHYRDNHAAGINFWANRSGIIAPGGLPIMYQHYHLSGEPVNVFSLLVEAGMANPNFAELIDAAAHFFQDHVPTCPHCKKHHVAKNCVPAGDWNFRPSTVQLLLLTNREISSLYRWMYLSHVDWPNDLKTGVLDDLKAILTKLAAIESKLHPGPKPTPNDLKPEA